MKGMLSVRTQNNLLPLVAVILLAWAAVGSSHVAAQETRDPCSSALGLPDPPGGHPKPTGGTVMDASTGLGIEGANVQLYRCVDGLGTLEASVATGLDGSYLFNDVDLGSYYYIKVSPYGPLLDLELAAGYSNPTAIFELSGEAATHDFGFE